MQTINDMISALKTERKTLGYSQKGLADLLGVTSRTVSSYERGEYLPSIPKLIEWCEALNLTLYISIDEPAVPEEEVIPCVWCSADMVTLKDNPDKALFCSEGCNYSSY